MIVKKMYLYKCLYNNSTVDLSRIAGGLLIVAADKVDIFVIFCCLAIDRRNNKLSYMWAYVIFFQR